MPPALFTITSQLKNCNNHKGTKFALAEKLSENVWPKLTLQRMLPTTKESKSMTLTIKEDFKLENYTKWL